MEKCNSCGTWNNDNTKFCRNCGKKLTSWGMSNEYTTTGKKSNENTTTTGKKTDIWEVVGGIFFFIMILVFLGII